MNLLFCINNNYTDLFLTCLKSIARSGDGSPYQVYILHSDLTEASERRIQESFPAIHFHFISVDEAIFEGFPEFKRYPKQIYYRLIAPLLLPETLDRILYLDVDLVVINSLEELYTSDFDTSAILACSHTEKILNQVNAARLGTDPDRPYINTGVMLMNLTMLRELVDVDAIRHYVEVYKHVMILPDQDILYGLYGDKIGLMDTMRYNLSDRILFFYNQDPRNTPVDLDWVRKHAVIIHYFGKNKPWKKNYIGKLGCFYTELEDQKLLSDSTSNRTV